MRRCGSEARRAFARAAIPVALAVGLAGCGGTPPAPEPAGVDDAPIVLGTPSPSATASNAPGRGDLDVEDQTGDGSSVAIRSVELGRRSGFLVVRDLQGTVLGVAPIRAGVRPVTVELTKPVTQSQELLAALYTDDGDGEFDPERDSPARDSDGEVVQEDFDYTVR